MRYAIGAIIAASLAAYGASAQAHGSEVARFNETGSGHQIVVNSDGTDSCLKGENHATGAKFDLHVSPSGMVDGTYDGTRVRFKASQRSLQAIRSLAAAGNRS
jgi:hypothetical protein